MKLKWKVSDSPTGKYRSFEKRDWPTAYYPNGKHAAQVFCEDAYTPPRAKGQHGHRELSVKVADYSVTPWVNRTLLKRFDSLDELKEEVVKILEKNKLLVPEEYRK